MKSNIFLPAILSLAFSTSSAQPGDPVWERSFGFGRNHMLRSVHATPDGGFIAGGDVSWSDTNTDYLILKLDASGREQWHKSFGGPGYDMGCYVIPASDGGYLAGG